MEEYINPIDKVIDYLKAERDRRVNALNSKEFCDTNTLKRNIIILEKAIITMENERFIDKINKK